MFLYKNILVTGCGGDIGISIGKILKQLSFVKKITGCDIHNEHAGRFIFDECIVGKKCSNLDYLKSMEDIVVKYGVDLIIPGSEEELRFLFCNNIDKINGVSIISANSKSKEIGFDKFTTANFLKKVGLPYPWTDLVSEKLPTEFPCIIKKRNGRGSKDVKIVYSKDEALFWAQIYHDGIWQEYLQEDDQEYTCGLYCSKSNDMRSIVFRRRLTGGSSSYGEVVCDNSINVVLHLLSKELQLSGSINVQLRKTCNGPVIFEINPRFSSTVLFRHLMGFCDVEWSLLEHKNLECPKYKQVSEKICFYRSYQEYVI